LGEENDGNQTLDQALSGMGCRPRQDASFGIFQGVEMLFCLSVCEETGRAILDTEHHGEVLAVIEARDFDDAREIAFGHPALDDFEHVPGNGWYRRRYTGCVDVAIPMSDVAIR